VPYDRCVGQGSKGEGRTASTVWDAAAPAFGRDAQRAAHGRRAERRASGPVVAPGAVTSWRPSAGLSPVERYGRFEILGRIGRGGMAEILLARERSPAGSTRYLVVKRVLPDIADHGDMLRMFLDEARVVMGLSHPNLCQIYEVGEQDGAWFIAMEWVSGVTLHQLIRRAATVGDVDYAVIARIVSHCAEALHHAHTARDAEGRSLHLVHRDVSPHNLMVAYDGRVKLLDFGIAKSTKSTHQTEAGIVKGKVCYMAPEQWLCNPLDARTDVFALGTCLYEALTGRVLFKRETQSEVMRAVLKEPVPSLLEAAPDVPPTLAEVAHRALSFNPDDRFQSALEMSDALERYLADRSEALSSARVAGYVRRLFRTEVELGPVLERSVRGAHLASAPVVLPPLPPSLLGLPKLTPSLLGFGELGGLPAAQISVLSSAAADAGPPLTPEAPSRDGLTISAQLVLDTHVLAELRESAGEITGEARPAVRTLSMPARRGLRAALIALPVCLALAASVFAVVKLQGRSDGVARTAHPPRPVAPAATLVAPAPAQEVAPPAPLASDPLASTPQSTVGRGKLGRLSINTKPWSTVYLGNRVLGTTPLADVVVPRGPIELKLVDRDGRVHLRRLPQLKKPTRSVFYDFETGAKPVKRKGR
jgi:serine/threonine protein kinase